MYVVSVDIAKKRDFFAIMVAKNSPEIYENKTINFADIVHLEQYQGLSFREMATLTAKVMGNVNLKNSADLLVDGTGVGEGAIQMMREVGLDPEPIIFTGSGAARPVYAEMGSVFATGNQGKLGSKTVKEWHIPKTDLVNAGQILLQQQRVRIAKGIRHEDQLRAQLAGFKGKVNEKGHRSYNAETEDLHDDLVVVFLMSAWWILSQAQRVEERIVPGKNEGSDWDPMREWSRKET